MREYCFAILIVCCVVPLVVSFLFFDAILRRQYESARVAWEADGSARGYFWTPAERRNPFGGSFTRDTLMRKWLFETPAWARGNPRFERLLVRLRISVAVWTVSAAGSILLAFAFCR